MSGVAALRGYRTQFLFSLHYILSHPSDEFTFKLEGEEDLDILDKRGDLLFAIQVKNLAKTLSLSDILSEQNTSFLRRFIDKYSTATPVLVSFGNISEELIKWESTADLVSVSEKKTLNKYQISEAQWKFIKRKTKFIKVEEEVIIGEILEMIKAQYHLIAPEPTAENVLYWLQYMAEKQISITTRELFLKVEDFTLYQAQCISVTEQYNLALAPLRKTSLSGLNIQALEEEFYNGINARYEHILLDIDVVRESYLNKIVDHFKDTNVVIVKGASGQGKSTLAYRYANQFLSQDLVYELNLQEDPINGRKAIQAIVSITKHLATPILFLINVRPNSTEWLKIIKEFASHSFVRFLITIRHEDWFKATAIGIDFLNREIEMHLSKNEAKLIFNMLRERRQVLPFPNFEEAWAVAGGESPLMEFIYLIAQGDSLKGRLKQQVLQLNKEDSQNANQTQVEFLRLICLANSFGLKIDISKLNYTTSFQFLIERLEKEYIIKVTGNGKSIAGVHLLRSEILSSILFDDFVSNKKDYAFKCLSVVADDDGYLFLLYCFLNHILTPEELIEAIKETPAHGWAYYHNVQKSLIWAGIRNYVYVSSPVLDECCDTYGDSWIFMIDVCHGDTYNIQEILDPLPFGNDFKEASKAFNDRMIDKQLVYEYIKALFNSVDFPTAPPTTELDWEGFGSTLFWLGNIATKTKPVVEIQSIEVERVFETLSLKRLATLMLGMYHSPYYNVLRQRFSHHFVSRMQKELRVVHVMIDDEISVDYIIDILNRNENLSDNDLSMEIIDLLRDAFPDKKKYYAKGHGHRLQLIPLLHDDTEKGIPIKNLPLENWVNINHTTAKLFSFTRRPKDWREYHDLVESFEKRIDSVLKEFNNVLSSYLKNPLDYKQLTALLKNVNYPYSVTIKEPQSISDNLGIYFANKKKKVEGNEAGVQEELRTKYSGLFKSQRGFQTGIENFIRQSGKALLARMEKTINPTLDNNSHSERLSKINLFDAIEHYELYKAERASAFESYGALHACVINMETLFSTAVCWNAYLNFGNAGVNINFTSRIRGDFEARIYKACKIVSKKNKGFTVKYINNGSTGHKPIMIINSENPVLGMLGFKEAYNLAKKAVGDPGYTSLKYLVLRLWFSKIYFIQLTKGSTINNQWNEIPLLTLYNHSFEDLAIYNVASSPIDLKVTENLSLKNWNEIFPKLDEVQKLSGAFIKMRLLVEHLYDLRYFETVELNEQGKMLFNAAVQSSGTEVQQSFQCVLDHLTNVLELFHFDAESYEADELEREYWNYLLAVRESIFPTDKGDEEDYSLQLNISSIEQWIERLKQCTDSWGIFTLLLSGKYIQIYEESRNVSD